jgi:hypothetical protein
MMMLKFNLVLFAIALLILTVLPSDYVCSKSPFVQGVYRNTMQKSVWLDLFVDAEIPHLPVIYVHTSYKTACTRPK